jgi:hypothetical protein
LVSIYSIIVRGVGKAMFTHKFRHPKLFAYLTSGKYKIKNTTVFSVENNTQ